MPAVVVAAAAVAFAFAEAGGSAELVARIFRPSGVAPGTGSDSETQLATESSSLANLKYFLKKHLRK